MIRAGSPRKKERDALSTPEIDAAVGFVDTKPTTLAGAVALLQYAMHQEEGGDAYGRQTQTYKTTTASRALIITSSAKILAELLSIAA